MNKSVKRLVKEARRQGWTVEIGGGGHVAYYSPEGEVVFGPVTPSDYRSLRNCRAQLRRAGLQLAEKGTPSKRAEAPRRRLLLPRADLKKIYDRATAYDISRSEVNALVRAQFQVKKTSHLPRRALKTVLTAIATEGKKRQVAAAEREAAQQLAATPEAKQGEQERERIRAIRQAKKNNNNSARLAARRAKRRRKRGKR